ncbi:transmembrane protein 248-like [Rhopilema esculentum]|uniref:transmembrane protein 248-like n=1 Tax=Rhopilema esculentum TaxID=499914 RepID=UPI0031D8EE52
MSSPERKSVYRNLVGFVYTRPPWVIFTIFLGVFAFGFFALGYYVQHSNIVDADSSKGWNSLYSNLTSLVFCLNSSSTADLPSSLTDDEYNQDFEFINISLPFVLRVRPYLGSFATNTSDLVGLLPNTYFKFGRKFQHESQFWISLDSSYLFGHCVLDEDEGSTRCQEVTYPACVTISLPSVITPLMRPRSCNNTINSAVPSIAVAVGKKNTNDRDKRQDESEKSICHGQIEVSLSKERTYDSQVMLSLAEKTRLNLKLQLASYFLFVIFLSFVLFAAIRGKPVKQLKKIIS